MRDRFSIFIMVFSVFLIEPISANSVNSKLESSKIELGAGIGWGAPYGTGIEGSYYLSSSTSLTSGIGLSIIGLNSGVGMKYFINPLEMFSPFVGANLTHSGVFGSNHTVSVNQDTAYYTFNPANIFTLRTGLRFQMGYVRFYGNVGYGFTLNGGASQYHSGSTHDSIASFVNTIEPGGLEVSFGASLRFPL